ncbi:MAG: YraN family protein [Planctomycetaceae bacterium]
MPRYLPHFLGDRGERAAVRFLKKQGCRILQRQHRNAYGEIDIIAEQRGTIVFVEVKTRSSEDGGSPWEAVDRKRRDRMSRAALCWLKKHRRLESPVRLDVISIVWEPGNKQPQVTHYPAAFESNFTGQMF